MTTNNWTTTHFRNGCWVESYLRSNGTRVKRHWRSGGNVSGHFFNSTQFSNQSPGRHLPQPPKSQHRRTPAILVDPSNNTAAMAVVLELNHIGRVRHRPHKTIPTPKAKLSAVIYRDAVGVLHTIADIPVATSMVNIPTEITAITLDFTITATNGDQFSYRIDSPVFFNADGEVIHVPGTEVDPELANRILDRINDRASELTVARRRNTIRARLGRHNPEKAVSQAAADMLKLNPMPEVNLTQAITIPVPGTNYTVTFKPADV